MNDEIREEEESRDVPEQPRPDPGAMLIEAREEQGYSLARVAHEIGLTESAVRDLEQNAYEKFPAGIYVRGYIKNYCKYIGVSDDEILRAYRKLVDPDEGRSNHRSRHEREGSHSGRSAALPWMIGVGILILIVVIYLGVTQL